MFKEGLIGLALIGTTSFAILFNNNEFLNANYCVATSMLSSFMEPKSACPEHSIEYASAAYQMYNHSTIIKEGIDFDTIFENRIFDTKLVIDFDFSHKKEVIEEGTKRRVPIMFNFNIESTNVFIYDRLNDTIRLYEDKDDAFYRKLIKLYDSYHFEIFGV